MPKLKDHEGRIVIVVFPPSQTGGSFEKRTVKLLSVDDAGIWVEDQKMTNDVLESLDLHALPALLAPFLPYSSIHAIFVNVPGMSLSEKAFGA